MTKFMTEEEVRALARDEWARLTLEKQAACKHAFSGTVHANAIVTCDQCEKVLTLEDVHFDLGAELSPVERRHVAKKERA